MKRPTNLRECLKMFDYNSIQSILYVKYNYMLSNCQSNINSNLFFSVASSVMRIYKITFVFTFI